MRLEALLKEDGMIEKIFSGTAEEILEKLAGHGIELSIDELNDLKEGFNEEMRSSDELTEDSLENVAGGCQDCSAHGRETGRKVAKWLRKVKNFLCFWDW